MAQFSYTAKDQKGKVVKGSMEANNKADVRSHIVRMRMQPLTIKTAKLATSDKDRTSFWSNFYYYDDAGKLQIDAVPARMTTKDLIIFTKQFATMLNSGVALIQSLDILSKQQRVRSFGNILKQIRFAVENGATLADAMEPYPQVFDNLYIAMVRAAEQSGNLDVILKKLIIYIEKAAKIKSQVKAAMMYPAMIVVVAVSVITGLLLFVVPAFAKTFTEGGKPLPDLTLIVINASNFVAAYWWYVPVFGSIGSFLLKRWTATDSGREKFDGFLLKLPGIGDLLRKIAVGRFCSTMSTMLTSGVAILDALKICAASAGNRKIENFILTVRQSISEGKSFAEPLGKGDIFPPMVVSMVGVGEQAGALDEMLTKISEFYEEEVDAAVKAVLSMIEPILIVVIGGIVGFVVIAMYLPIFDMASAVGG
jgi:type IV pilus assembly protein PilC